MARALLPSYDELLRDGALTSVKTAKPHDAHARYLRQTVPGIGKLLSLVLLAIHQIDRCPRAQDFAAYCRLGKCAKESAGKRSGTSGPKLGHAPLQGLSPKPPSFLGILRQDKNSSHDWRTSIVKARHLPEMDSIYCMLKNKRAFDRDTCFHSSGRGVGELAASLDHAGLTLTIDALLCPNTCVAERR